MTSEHTLRSFDVALGDLDRKLGDMARRVVSMIETAMTAFRRADIAAAQSVIAQDPEIDRAFDAINAAVLDLLVRFQPLARDLRDIVAAQRIASNIERIADHAKGIGKRTIALAGPNGSPRALATITEMERLVLESFRDVIAALETREIGSAEAVISKDEQIDRRYDDLFHIVIADLKCTPEAANNDVQVLFVGKAIERIGDRLTNIAEEIRFMLKGEMPTATRGTHAS